MSTYKQNPPKEWPWQMGHTSEYVVAPGYPMYVVLQEAILPGLYVGKPWIAMLNTVPVPGYENDPHMALGIMTPETTHGLVPGRVDVRWASATHNDARKEMADLDPRRTFNPQRDVLVTVEVSDSRTAVDTWGGDVGEDVLPAAMNTHVVGNMSIEFPHRFRFFALDDTPRAASVRTCLEAISKKLMPVLVAPLGGKNAAAQAKADFANYRQDVANTLSQKQVWKKALGLSGEGAGVGWGMARVLSLFMGGIITPEYLFDFARQSRLVTPTDPLLRKAMALAPPLTTEPMRRR